MNHGIWKRVFLPPTFEVVARFAIPQTADWGKRRSESGALRFQPLENKIVSAVCGSNFRSRRSADPLQKVKGDFLVILKNKDAETALDDETNELANLSCRE